MCRQVIQSCLSKLGYQLRKREHDFVARCARMLTHFQIDLVLDVGANAGQYAGDLREFGYTKRIVSFEPLAPAFETLARKARRDPNWQTFNLALGDCDGASEINVSSNSFSSSLLPILPAHVASAPQSAYVGKQAIQVRTLDSVFNEVCRAGERVFLKIDTQGYERRILEGGRNSLPRIQGVQVELSLVPLYEGETLFTEMLPLIQGKGFELTGLDPGFYDVKTGQLLQLDCVFFRSRPA
jgi:FkbM family methyltransferase